MTITMIVETKWRPTFLPKRERKPWLKYSVWQDLHPIEPDGEQAGYLLWERLVPRRAPWEVRQQTAREQERIAYAAAQANQAETIPQRD